MDLRTHLAALSPDERERLAIACQTTVNHLRNVAYGSRTCSPLLAVALERESGGDLSRKELRPDWEAIWPELARDGEVARLALASKAAHRNRSCWSVAELRASGVDTDRDAVVAFARLLLRAFGQS